MYIEKEGEMAFQERKGGLSPEAEKADVQNGGSRVCMGQEVGWSQPAGV